MSTKMQLTYASSGRLRRYSERSVETFKASLTVHPSSVVLKKGMQMMCELQVSHTVVEHGGQKTSLDEHKRPLCFLKQKFSFHMHIDACDGIQCMHYASVGYHIPRAYYINITLNTTLLSLRGKCVYGKQVCTSCSVKWCSIKCSTEDSIKKHTDNMEFFFTFLYSPTSRQAHTSTHWNQFRLDMHFIPGS